MKYERAAKELEFTKRRLQTQHEHDLDQLIGLKKQLEKKLADAYEEVEEQRQVVGQWKRKSQKLSSEMNDLRMLLDEQNGRNNLLEKKQRKFDSESQSLQVIEASCPAISEHYTQTVCEFISISGCCSSRASSKRAIWSRKGCFDCRKVQSGTTTGGEYLIFETHNTFLVEKSN